MTEVASPMNRHPGPMSQDTGAMDRSDSEDSVDKELDWLIHRAEDVSTADSVSSVFAFSRQLRAKVYNTVTVTNHHLPISLIFFLLQRFIINGNYCAENLQCYWDEQDLMLFILILVQYPSHYHIC